ncbi:SGNH/GDSL hydrolase family protein [Lederbergia wuyishanensis]|uniref:Lysophospholipase L1-like esterase n=1 Tax=Lederbergia wuyishanensis TaxID=1347903 RepID=A0ABU0D5U5_9BACI|nr:GDSL-type esterase/lipase family protein [Lederbergia wuyishanensis]MCJ8008358.1 GDSL-type esterase/lipase family protein [Lederbergia wuyishanensis]MDQ0343771.1 lysophospholipase L1-like esterase [Lederbergia wuyishanensis]
MKIALIGDSLTEGRPGVSFARILQKKYENINIKNLGKPGETVTSLNKRLRETEIEESYDLSFLWIGVNDVFSKLLKVQAQPVVQNNEEFKECYEKVLELVLRFSNQVVVVSPALVGENTKNTSNKKLQELTAMIQTLASKYPNITFINMHSVFLNKLEKVTSSDYIGTSVMKMMVETLFYKSHSKIDDLSTKRGLHFTLDGVHFNSKGATIVADVYSSIIDDHLKKFAEGR